MTDTKLREALAGYQQRRWFPGVYSDSFGEWIDYINTQSIDALRQNYEQTGNAKSIDIAYFLLQMIPQVAERELYRSYHRALSTLIGRKQVPPDAVYYFIRALSESDSLDLWRDFVGWLGNWETPLFEWLHAVHTNELKHQQLYGLAFKNWEYDSPALLAGIQSSFFATRELFNWQLSQRLPGATLYEILRSMRLQIWDNVADWNDFAALARSFEENCGIKRVPILQRSNREELQYVYPIDPPNRIILQHGSTAGLLDTIRFVFEFGRGCFYAGINPNLDLEARIIGDPALPLFWGSLFIRLLVDPTALKTLVNLAATEAAMDIRLLQQFSVRHQAALATYKSQVDSDLGNARDVYGSCIESFLGITPSRELYLYELNRSNDSLYRIIADRAADAVEEKLKSRYGNGWFTSQQVAKKFRDYWWDGYTIRLVDVLRDLGVTPE